MTDTEGVSVNRKLSEKSSLISRSGGIVYSMFDTAHVETADEMISRTNNLSDLVSLCQDYFKISIGVRKPSQPEINDALPNLMGAFNESKPTPEERIQAMMYPIADTPTTIRMVLAHEYVVYQILAQETGIIHQPYIPMIRYEIQMQDELAEERRYNEAIVRQAALFQTYLRMTQSNFNMRWTDCLTHGRDKITPPRLSAGAKDRIEEVYEVRSNMGHDWRVYVEPTADESQHQVFAKGQWVLEELRAAELNETYENYTDNSASLRLPVWFRDRERATATVNAVETTVTRSCPECGETLEKEPDICKNCGWASNNPVNP